MQYYHWLLVLSALFAVVERLRPWRPTQRVWRQGMALDLFYLVFNGHFLGLWLATLTFHGAQAFARAVNGVGLEELVFAGLVSSWNPVAQFLVVFFALDLIQWSVHNVLHRVGWLWEFHKLHHSIEELDWIGSFRFHWAEVLVYKAAQYIPLLILGFQGQVLLVYAVFSTFMGFWNHSNLDVDIGRLRYIFNNPRMHVWHHDRHEVPIPPGVNFAINLSLWDWLFGTAWLPGEDRQPRGLGFQGLESFPSRLVGQLLYPLPLPRLLSGAGGRKEDRV